jgi:hypothetical protein
MRAAKIGKPSWNKGKKLSDEHRARLRGPRGPQPNMRKPHGHWFTTVNGATYVDFKKRAPNDVRGRLL